METWKLLLLGFMMVGATVCIWHVQREHYNTLHALLVTIRDCQVAIEAHAKQASDGVMRQNDKIDDTAAVVTKTIKATGEKTAKEVNDTAQSVAATLAQLTPVEGMPKPVLPTPVIPDPVKVAIVSNDTQTKTPPRGA